MRRLGLKIWSTDIENSAEAERLVKDAVYDYVELFSVPGSFSEVKDRWSSRKIQYVIHAPHSLAGLNFARPEQQKKNSRLAAEALRFADYLFAEVIIFHPGLDGPIEESIRQMSLVRDNRLHVENVPMMGLSGERCNGSTPSEIAQILKAVECKFCLDFGHSIAAANMRNANWLEQLEMFRRLDPSMYHLTDGWRDGIVDTHIRYGFGDYPLRQLLRFVPDGAAVTNEAARAVKVGLHEAQIDAAMFRTLEDAPSDYGIEMHRATEKDADEIYNLSNDPTVRRSSFNTAVIGYDEHLSWYNSKISDSKCFFLIFRFRGELVGQLRLERNEPLSVDVSISVTRAFRGAGYGKQMIEMGLGYIQRLMRVKRAVAYIKPSNAASQRFFGAVGFKVTPDMDSTCQSSRVCMMRELDDGAVV
jgi:RimJ/RimL family protein N-acetyltransferase